MPDTWDTTDGQTQYEPKNLHKESHHKEHYDAQVKAVHHYTPASVVPGVNLEPSPPKPSVGRIVHLVLDGGPHKSEHRPAIITKIWPEYNGIQHVQLQVFTDGSNDGEAYRSGICWATSVHYADPSENKPYSWHWPERV
jgi:hypothetical protein